MINYFLDNCETVGCHEHADCSWIDEWPVCQCKDGYNGDGKTCTKGIYFFLFFSKQIA